MNQDQSLLELFKQTRADSETICKPLAIEDYVVQPIVDVSPPKWHLGHTTWFFEEFLLAQFLDGYKRYDERYAYVFNSYYESMGKRVVRTDRGNLSRPSVADVYSYREHVTNAMTKLLSEELDEQTRAVVEIGIHHEKQHQELLLTDIKYILGNNPLQPVYGNKENEVFVESHMAEMLPIKEGIYHIGHDSDDFCYDNEEPKHRVFVEPYSISNKLVTNGEWMEFMEDGGYENVLIWHTEGWDWVQKNNINAPMYWFNDDGEWTQYLLSGSKTIDPKAAVTHICYYEAFAYAQWKGMRLPTEFEWEIAQEKFKWGKRWEWTESAYLPYPNYLKADGALGEYNGKFMVNQKVLRGSSIATASNHARPTYRNFFHPYLRWQFTGLRLAKSL
ncbi:ergothioneine biosynthesis protein EgtB [Nonlabens sp. Hel1_33_55]|uniref:ergothioneine biosynthesis protein EgtB n=1 Tax=Nonlabens sp. Hel1_33_55 TaxID=1336802 RepID=UPI000875D089|nr:ergothioneine biosynthesis protein EgtB [Nonlabens sp. Hel1_33_55]SCY27294.1 ergothioneine biosynthesis protein EgtB [Nonlabens sp. Hel1_33_55]